jgi:maltooligosyltrehalose trehalohydrolase
MAYASLLSQERTSKRGRRFPIGAEPTSEGQAHFRVWASRPQRVEVVLHDAGEASFPLTLEGNGYFSATVEAGPGTRYRFRLDGEEQLYPDPASRFQPEGPHCPSEVIDPFAFAWTDAGWPGIVPQGRVIYEMHIGTFTHEGTWRSAMEQLPRLADLGINVLEVMPVADFPGRFGWGYDGVDLFAPTRLYGRPDDFRAFVDRAHALGLGVILDVVYNHFGPDGNYLRPFSPDYFHPRHRTEWGDGLNFDGPNREPVREFFTTNAAYWIDEFHLDGLRLDAVHSILDDSPDEHILAAISRATRKAAGSRSILLVAENEKQQAYLSRAIDRGGYGLDMQWNDDFHHSMRVALTGRTEGYYHDFRGAPQELLSGVKYGYLFQGQYYAWQKHPRGTPALDLPPYAFVSFIDNHDQVSNSATGLRTHALTGPGRYRACTALLLLMPATPMLFQGQEFASSAPFYYFADHHPELAKLVSNGRREFLTQFSSLAQPNTAPMPEPHEIATFERCKLDLSEIERHDWAVQLHRDLLRLRREDQTFRLQKHRGIDGAILGPEALVLRFFGEEPAQDRLLLFNLGTDLDCAPMAEPLLAPPAGLRWQLAWSSEDLRYGGAGAPALRLETVWLLPGQGAFVLAPAEPPG